MDIDGFPIFSAGTDQGLIKLNPNGLTSMMYSTRHYKKMVKDFNNKLNLRPADPIQPPFLIKKESWALLTNGQQINEAKEVVSWLKNYTGYEVYAFVFCLAFHQSNQSPYAYFRIRTILKKTGATPAADGYTVLVETDNIAYVNLDIALDNFLYGHTDDCLSFITAEDTNRNPITKRLKEKIDNEVYAAKKDPYYNPAIVPAGFKTSVDNKIVVLIDNEGSIFGKSRIWDELLIDKYHLTKDTLIELAWDENTRHVSFYFKINDGYGTSIQCPQPPVCTKTAQPG